MHREIQISEGVYVTDFRPNCELKGINTQPEAKAKDVGLLLDKIACNQSKIQQLIFSIGAIKQQDDWQTDQVLLEAIEQNYKHILRFSNSLKEYILDLSSLKYQPETDKIQELINPCRITERQTLIKQEFEKFQLELGSACFEEKYENELVQVEKTKDQDNNKNENNNDKGIYL